MEAVGLDSSAFIFSYRVFNISSVFGSIKVSILFSSFSLYVLRLFPHRYPGVVKNKKLESGGFIFVVCTGLRSVV